TRGGARDYMDRFCLWGMVATWAAGSYLISLCLVPAGDFHGLVTPEPGDTFVDDHPGRPHLLYSFNTHGFRRPEWSVEKPSGTLRVALVGDSFVFGYGVEEPETLSAQLATQLARRWPERRIEVLNLGIGGHNLVSHVQTVEVAEEALDADVVVLCLTLPNDLSRWDAQQERREARRIGAFSAAGWAFGVQTAVFFWDVHGLSGAFTPEGALLLREQADRLKAFRAKHGERPLLVLPFQDSPPDLLAPIREMPNVRLLPTVERRPEYFIPGDGHPTGVGNRVFAEMLGEALAKLPPLSSPLP
ncbi:MAG: SGNH/GDSL hydrolase family protein, partial [Minicystis sp.]